MHCMLMDLLHGFEVLSTTEETLFNSRNVSRLVQNKLVVVVDSLKLVIFISYMATRDTRLKFEKCANLMQILLSSLRR